MVISKQCNSLERQFYGEAKVAETVYAGGKKPWVNLNFWPGMPKKMLLKVFRIYMYFLYFHGLSDCNSVYVCSLDKISWWLKHKLVYHHLL